MTDEIYPEFALRVRHLSKNYRDIAALDDVSFDVRRGEILGLVGSNGAGKTTTLRCLAGILRPSSGLVSVAGHDLTANPLAAKRALAFIPDEPQLFEYLTVLEHLDLTARLYGVGDWRAAADTLLEELELTSKRNAIPEELSRGMKQKLNIACGFLHEPSLILLDEPLTGLDPIAIRKMKESIAARAARGCSVVLSSHLLPLVEEMCTRILLLAAGKVFALGSLDELRRRPGVEDGDSSGSGGTLEDLFIRVEAKSGKPR